MTRLSAFAAGLVLGAWAGFRLWPRSVAEPARPFSYTDPLTWTRVSPVYTTTQLTSPSYTVTYSDHTGDLQ